MRNFNESSLDDFVEVKEDLIPMEDVQDVKVDYSIQDCLDETTIEVTKETTSHGLNLDSAALLNDKMKSLQDEFKSTKADIEAMVHIKLEENITAILEEMKALKMDATLAKASILEVIDTKVDDIIQAISQVKVELASTKTDIEYTKEATACDKKFESGEDLVRAADIQRRIELAVANADSHPLLDCDSYEVLEVHHFYRITSDGRRNGSFDCRRFISVALSMFRIKSGVLVPTDVVYDHVVYDNAPSPSLDDYTGSLRRTSSSRHGLKKATTRCQSTSTLTPHSPSSTLPKDEQEAMHFKFQTTILNFFHSLLGFTPRIEKDDTGNVMMFYD